MGMKQRFVLRTIELIAERVLPLLTRKRLFEWMMNRRVLLIGSLAGADQAVSNRASLRLPADKSGGRSYLADVLA
jgi:hypothetical protein